MKGRIEMPPRERLLISGAELFAQKGFSAVGVREVTDKAGVNVSMTSYYFGGKNGLLKAIYEDFFRKSEKIIKEVALMNKPTERKIKELIDLLIKMMMENENICRVAIFELPFDIPELREFKEKLFKENIKMITDIFNEKYNINDESLQLIIGPAFYSILFSHCYYSNALQLKEDSKYYKIFQETVKDFIIRGLSAFEKKKK